MAYQRLGVLVPHFFSPLQTCEHGLNTRAVKANQVLLFIQNISPILIV